MGGMSRLLNKQFRIFTGYALIVLLCSIPVYFFIVDHIWVEELDEHNRIIAIQTQAGLDSLVVSDEDLPKLIWLWNKTRPGSTLTPANPDADETDSIYEITRSVGFSSGMETDRFRGLATRIYINKKTYRLTVETNVEESEETFAAIATITGIFFLVLVAGFIFLNRKLAASAWKPFNTTLQKLRLFHLGSGSSLKLEHSGIAEFEELNNTLEKLVERNVAVYREQKEFTENASHELQTPLALIQSRLDLLLQTNGLTAEQSELIVQINKTLSRISHLNKNLLLLAGIDNQQYAGQETIDLSRLCEESAGLYAELVQEHGNTFHVHIGKEIYVTANPVLAEVLLNNLLSNAVRHNIPSGKIMLTLTPGLLQIRNQGESPLNENNLYKRFSGVSVSSLGSGLGLAISMQVCNLYGWKINYSFNGGMHCFSVSF
jgi:signal transduction histidine kinase